MITSKQWGYIGKRLMREGHPRAHGIVGDAPHTDKWLDWDWAFDVIRSRGRTGVRYELRAAFKRSTAYLIAEAVSMETQ